MGIRGRLALWYGWVFALALALMVLFNYATYVDEQYRSVDRQMRRGALQFQTEWAQGNPLTLNNFFSENYTIIRRYTALGQLRDSSHPWLELPPSNPIQLLLQAPPSDPVSRFRRWVRPPVEAPPGANFVITTINGERWRLYIYTLRTPNVGYLELMTPLGETDARMGVVGRNLLLGGGVTLLLMLLGGWAIANRVLRPITRLTRTAQRVAASNNLSRRVEVPRSRDELSQLARTFNGMMDKLEAEQRQLETRVEERTAELVAAQKRAEFLAALGDAVQAVGNPDEVARVAFDRLGVLLGAEYLALSWVGEGQINLGQVWGRLPAGLEQVARAGLKRSQGGMLWRVVEGREALYSNDYAQESYHLELGLHHYAIAAEPVINRGGEIVATLSIGRIGSSTGWQDGEKDLIKRAANTLGLALERSERLAMAETRVDMAIEATNLGLWSMDLSSGRVTWGGRHAALYGFPPNTREVEVGELEGLVFPSDVPLIQARLEQAVQDLQPYEVEYRIQRRDNAEWRSMLARGQAVRGNDGRVAQILGTVMDVTEQHKAMAQIEAAMQAERQTAAQLEAMFNNLPVGIALFDRDFRYVSVNPVLAQINRRPVEEHIGRTLEEVLPSSGKQLRSYMEQVLETGQPITNVELSGQHDADPSQMVYALASWFPVRLNGQTLMVGAAVQDITERKRAEGALADSERRYRSLVEASAQVVWRADASGRLLEPERRWAQVSGVPLAELPADLLELVHPDDRQRGDAQWQAAVAGSDGFNFEQRVRHAGGGERYWLTRAAPVRGPDGQVLEWIGTDSDITARKEAEAALRVSEQRMRLAVQANRMVAWEWDAADDRVTTTDNFAEIYGLPAVARAAEGFALIWPEDLPAHQAHVQRVASEGGGYVSEFRITRPADGRTVWLEERATALTDPDGRVVRLVGVVSDVSERKLAEQRLAERERFVQNLVQTAPAVIYVMELPGHTNTYVSSRGAALLGYGLEEWQALWRDPRRLMHPDDWVLAEAHLGRLVKTPAGEVQEFEYRMRHKDGSWRWFMSRDTVSERDSEGRPTAVLGVASDITERKRLELEALLMAEISELTARQADAEGVLRAASGLIARHFGAARVIFTEVDEAANQAQVLREWRAEGLLSLEGRYPLSEYVSPEALQRLKSDRPSALADPAEHPVPGGAERLRQLGVGAVAHLPYHDDGRLRFLLVLALPGPHRWEAGELALLRELAGRVWGHIGRIRAVSALRQSEAEFRLLAEGLPQFVWVTDERGQLSYVNSRWTEFSGLSLEQTRDPQQANQIYHPDDLEQVNRAWAKAFETLEPFEVEARMGRGGEYRWFLVRGEPLKDRQGRLLRWFGTSTDISQVKQAEAALRQNRERLELGVQVAGLALAEVDYPSGLITLSPEAAALYGLTAEGPTVSRERIHATFHPEEQVELETIIAQVLDPQGPGWFARDHRVVHPDGQTRWLSVRKQVFFDHQASPPRPLRATLAALDITERKRAEEALTASEARLSQVLNQSHIGIVEADAAGRMTLVNPRWCELLGYSEAELLGMTVLDVTHPDSLEATLAAVGRLAAGGPDFVIEKRYRRRDGSTLEASSSVSARRGPGGEYLGLVAAVLDITERKRLELNRAFLAELRAALALLSEPRQVAAVLGERLVGYLGVSRCLLVEIDEAASTATVFYDSQPADGSNMLGDYSLAEFHTLDERVSLAAGQAVVIEDVGAGGRSPQAVQGFEALGIGALITAPYLSGGRWRFALGVQQDKPRVWQADEVRLVRDMAALIYPLLERARAEEAVRQGEERYRTLFESIDQGFSVFEMVYEVGRAVDYRFLEVNPMFEEQTGLKDAAGRTATELVPGLEREWIERYASVAESGVPLRFEQGSEAMGRWFEVYAMRVGQPEGRRVAVLFSDITRRKRAELERERLLGQVETERALLNLVLQAAPVGFALLDSELRYLRVNDALAEINGLSPEAHLGRRIEEVIPDIAPAARPAFEQVFQTGEPLLNLELSGETTGAPGVRRDWLESVYRVATPDGVALGLGVVVMDVTEQKRYQKALQESRNLLRLIIDNLAAFVGLLEPNGKVIEANASALSAADLTTAEVIGRPFWETYWWSYDPQVQAQLQDAIAQARAGQTVSYDVWVRAAGDSLILIEFRLAPLFDDEGRIRYLVPSGVNITERNRAEEGLRQSEQRLEMAVRSGGIGIFDWDIPNDHIHWSDIEHQIFGLEPGQFGGRLQDWRIYALSEDRERVETAMQLAMQERREWMDFAFRIRRANDGALRYIEGTARFIYDALGFPLRMVGVNIDVSERAKALEALQESEAKLRTLVESQKRFVADASHELRAPLTSIQGNLELLQRFKNMTTPDREAALSEAGREAARLGRLVSDLLALARGDAGMKLQLEPTHLGEVLEEAVSELQHLSGGKQVIAGNLPEVRINAQRDKLKQLAIILLENALKYTPIGGTVRLELRQQQGQAELRVSDNGIGIAPEDLPRVFERFYRADLSRSKTQDPGGTGLGLPIAKWIVEQHGGEIWLESVVEKGTTAIVRLPVLQLDPAGGRL